jgi:hypothetical protein
MKQTRLSSAAIATVGLTMAVGLSTPAWASANLDPFARNTRANVLNPFRTAQAEMAEPEGGTEKGESESPSGGSGTDNTPHQPPSAARTPVAATSTSTSASTTTAAGGKSCSRDDECSAGTICEHGVCQAFERPFDLLLYRRDGASTDLIPFYFSLRGNPGHRVVAPFYWHFWSPESRTKIVFPFYWRVEDHLKQRVVTVVGLYSHTRQPDARSWAVWPFFYASTKFGWAAPLLGSFTIGDPDRQKALGLLGFLYFWKRNGDDKFDVSPLFISTRSKQSAFTFALPLNFYWRNESGSNLLILPIGLRHTNKDGGYFGSLLGYSSVEGESKSGSFLWLYWFGRSPTDNYDVGFPLLWSFRSPESSTTVVPPVFHARRGNSYIGSAALLSWWGGNRDKGSNWQLFLPFYYGGRGDHGKTALYLSPLGGYRRDDNAGSHGLTWLAPPILRWHDRQSELESYLLLYWHYRDIQGDSDTTLVGNYYQRKDPNGSTRVVFPLFWSFKDKRNGASAHSLFPFYFHRHSAEERTTTAGIFPLWAYWRRFADGGHSAGLFPFVFSGERHDRSHLIVAPLLWHFRNQDKSSTLALPLWYHSRDANSSHTYVPPLLYFSGQDRGASYHIQIPLFWHFADSRRGTSTTIAPLFFRDVDRNGTANGILPLLFWGGGSQRSHFVLFPIFWHFRDDSVQRSTTVAGLYWHRRWGNETTDALFPIFHYRRGTRPGGQEESSLTLFPLFHHRKNSQASLFLSPLAAWTNRPGLKAGFAGPYFWVRNDQVDAQGVPLLYLDHTRLSTGERTRMFGPWIMVDSPSVSTRVLFPLYARFREKGDVGTYVFPLYFGRRSDSGYHLDSFLPFYWSSYDQHHRALSIGPWFSTRNHQTQSRATGLLPLYAYAKNPQRSFLATPLFYYHRNHETQTSQVIAPLYFQSSHPDGGWRVVFPLWWQSRNKGESQAFLFPLFWHFANRDEQSSFTLAGPLLWSHKGTDRTRGLLPLGWYSRDPQNETGSNALMPLFYESHTRTNQTFATALFGFGTGPDRFWMYVPPFVWKDNSKSRFSMLFPLWFSSTNKAAETNTRVIPPLLHYSRSTPTHSLSTALLLYWRKTNVLSSTTLGLPLYYDIHNYRDSRLTMFLPLYMRYRNHVSEQTYNMVFPLFYRRSGPTDATTIAFPLYWRFWSQERSTTVLFPLYWGVRRATWEGAYIFPTIWTSKGLGPEAGTSNFWVFPFWHYQVKRPGDVSWDALLGLAGYERIGRSRFLTILFIPFELEPVSPAKTAWYGRAPKRPAPRGLSTQIW